MNESKEKRWKIILVDRTQYFRRPRSKKRRILKKWRKRKENYRPLMVPVGSQYLIGSGAIAAAKAGEFTIKEPDYWTPYYDEEAPHKPRIMQMHTKLWEKVVSEAPEFAAKCDLFKRVVRNFGCIRHDEDVLCSRLDYSLLAPLPPTPDWILKIQNTSK